MLDTRIESMVVGIDLSDTGIAAALWAASHFAPAAKVTLLHVIDPPDRPRFASSVLPPAETVEMLAREHAEHRMGEIAARLPRAPRVEIRVGKPHDVVSAVARETSADLVVVGPHDDRPRPSRFLGTTAERIVRTSPVSVLVASHPPAGRPRNLLVPVDDHEITTVLLEWTHDLAAAFDVGVTLLHVWSNATYGHVASMSYATERSESSARAVIDAEMNAAASRWLDELARTGMQGDRVSARVSHGKAGDVVLETAAAMRADLIALGRRGSGVVSQALLGSTVSTVLGGATCPVLVIAERSAARGARV